MSARDRLRVFVVEDEALIALELENIIEDLQHEVIGPLANVTQALDRLSDLEQAPDAAIVDANLGGTSARPVVEALAALGVPVVIASGYEAIELERLGFSGAVLRKPYSLKDVENALAGVVGI
jgi:CheY-like chemotaxis protein